MYKIIKCKIPPCIILHPNRHASWQLDKAEVPKGEPGVFIMRFRFGLALGGSYGFQEGMGAGGGMCGNVTEVVGHALVEEGASCEKEGREEGGIPGDDG